MQHAVQEQRRTAPGLVVAVGRQGDGWVFALDGRSRAKLRALRPDAEAIRQVFVAFDTRTEFERAHGSIWKQVVLMLTGMGEHELHDLSPIRFFDPMADEDLREVSF